MIGLEGVKSVRAVERALDLLDRFLESAEPIGVGEAARLSGMPKSTVYRLLLTMESRGYLERTGEDERFVLGARLRAAPAQPVPDIRQVTQSIIEGLRDTCGETVGLHLLEGDERVCVAAAEGVRTLHTSGRVGGRAPLYSGASARAIMAFLPEFRRDQIISTTGLAPLTSHTITDPAQLKAELARIRAEGFAVSTGEWSEGITSVAVPIFNPDGSVVGSVNISGPTFRFGEEKISLLVGALKAAAEVINQRLKGTGAGGHAE